MRFPCLALTVLLLWPATVFSQGVLTPEQDGVRLPRPHRPVIAPPVHSYCLDEISVEAQVRDQVADVQVSQVFTNTGSGTLEATFVFPLPYDGAIDRMTLMVNGREIPARLLSAEEARDRYQSIVRRNRDPALLEWVGTGMFQTSVFPIPPGESRTVSLRYTQLLRQQQSLSEFLFPLSTARYTSRPVKSASIRVHLHSTTGLKNLYSTTHEVEIRRPDKQRAIVTWKSDNAVPQSDFRLLYSESEGDVAATLLSYRPEKDEDGYFLLLATPGFQSADQKSQQKSLVFVVDKSGSMNGPKIEQAREAAKNILNGLHEDDLFNVIGYEGDVQLFQPELQRYDSRARRSGLAFVDSLTSGGSTNINDALQRAFAMLQDPDRPSYVIFLTDGLPTAGETSEPQIAKNAREANRHGARLLTFGVGHDVNSRLLDRLSRENRGASEYVLPDEDIEARVSRVFQRINSPVLTNIDLSLENAKGRKVTINRRYPAGPLDLFAGEQLIVVGRYQRAGDVTIRLAGTVDGQPQEFTFSGTLEGHSDDSSRAFVAKLWATRRIGELIDQLDLHGRNEELVEELTRLSTRHGILTPYTSFLADETVLPQLSSVENFQRTDQLLSSLEVSGGQAGFAQRGVKQSLNHAKVPFQAGRSVELLAEFGLPSEPQSVPSDSSVVQKDADTLYRKGKLIMTPETAELDLQKDQARITTIERFTPEYFHLVTTNSRAENQLLAEQGPDEELLVRLQGNVYLIK